MFDGPMVPSAASETSSGAKAMEWDVVVDSLAVASPVHMECVRVPAGELLMGSHLAKER